MESKEAQEGYLGRSARGKGRNLIALFPLTSWGPQLHTPEFKHESGRFSVPPCGQRLAAWEGTFPGTAQGERPKVTSTSSLPPGTGPPLTLRCLFQSNREPSSTLNLCPDNAWFRKERGEQIGFKKLNHICFQTGRTESSCFPFSLANPFDHSG